MKCCYICRHICRHDHTALILKGCEAVGKWKARIACDLVRSNILRKLLRLCLCKAGRDTAKGYIQQIADRIGSCISQLADQT